MHCFHTCRMIASIGPQHIAAENFPQLALEHACLWQRFNGAAAHRCGKPSSWRISLLCPGRFNGAAAHRCGKRPPGLAVFCDPATLQWGRSTSLRKTLEPQPQLPQVVGFNGAAAHRCGKRRKFPTSKSKESCFNGAAAHRCGKQSLLRL